MPAGVAQALHGDLKKMTEKVFLDKTLALFRKIIIKMPIILHNYYGKLTK